MKCFCKPDCKFLHLKSNNYYCSHHGRKLFENENGNMYADFMCDTVFNVLFKKFIHLGSIGCHMRVNGKSLMFKKEQKEFWLDNTKINDTRILHIYLNQLTALMERRKK